MNQLTQIFSSKNWRQMSKAKFALVGACLVLVVIAASAIFQLAAFAHQAYSISRQSEQIVNDIESASTETSPTELRQFAFVTSEDLRNLKESSGWEIAFIDSLGFLPFIGTTVSSAPDILDSAQVGVNAALVLLDSEDVFRSIAEEPASLRNETERQSLIDLENKLKIAQDEVTSRLSTLRQQDRSGLRFGIKERSQRLIWLLESEEVVFEWLREILLSSIDIGNTASQFEEYLITSNFDLDAFERDPKFLNHLSRTSTTLERLAAATVIPSDSTASRLISAMDEGRIQKLSQILESSVDLIQIGTQLLGAISDVREEHSDNELGILHSGAIAEIVEILRGSSSEIDGASEAFSHLSNLLPVGSFANGKFESVFSDLENLLTLTNQPDDLTLVLDKFFGIGESSESVVLLSTSDELRPGGGFVSALAHLEFDQSILVRNDVYSTYRIESDRSPDFTPVVPTELAIHMDARQYYIRDSLWSPDFGKSASFVKDALEYGPGIQPDLVIAITQSGFLDLVDSLGVRLPTSNPVGTDAKTNAELLELGTDQEGADYIRDSLKALTEGLSSNEIPLLGTVLLLHRLQMKQEIQLYGFNDELQKSISALGWSRDLFASSERLLVVDANVGWNKVDRNIQRSMRFKVSFDETTSNANVSLNLSYENLSSSSNTSCEEQLPPPFGTAYQDLVNACYWNFVRVYPPLGSTGLRIEPMRLPANSLASKLGHLLSSSNATYIGIDSTGSYIGGLFKLDPADEITLEINYSIPEGFLVDEENRITFKTQFFAQPGANGRTTKIEIQPPGGYQYLDSTHTPLTVSPKLVTYEFSGITDDDFSIRFVEN